MFIAKELFLDRVEQSFLVFKKTFRTVCIPFIIFNIIFTIVLPFIFMNIFSSVISFDELSSWSAAAKTSIYISLAVTIALVFFIVYSMLVIPLQLYVLKSIHDTLEDAKRSIQENISYSFKYLTQAFSTYWYIFAYMLLVPALIFIAGGFFIIWGMYLKGSVWNILSILWYIFVGLSTVIGVYFWIYRGLKSSFGLISAVEKESFTKENFKYSLGVSKNQWGRIFWNLVWVGIGGSLLIGIISQFGKTIVFSTQDFSILSEIQNTSPDWKNIIEHFNSFNIYSFLNKIFQHTLSSTLGIFVIIFTYILFKRLEIESQEILPQETKKELIQEL